MNCLNCQDEITHKHSVNWCRTCIRRRAEWRAEVRKLACSKSPWFMEMYAAFLAHEVARQKAKKVASVAAVKAVVQRTALAAIPKIENRPNAVAVAKFGAMASAMAELDETVRYAERITRVAV